MRFRPVEAFSWGPQRCFTVDQVFSSDDPAVVKFPHLFEPDGEWEAEPEAEPVKRGPGRPRKVRAEEPGD